MGDDDDDHHDHDNHAGHDDSDDHDDIDEDIIGHYAEKPAPAQRVARGRPVRAVPSAGAENVEKI